MNRLGRGWSFGGIDFLDNCFGATALGAEIDFDGREGLGLRWLLGLTKRHLPHKDGRGQKKDMFHGKSLSLSFVFLLKHITCLMEGCCQ